MWFWKRRKAPVRKGGPTLGDAKAEEFRRLIAAATPTEDLIAWLRAEGLSKVESIRELIRGLDLDHTEAKILVHESEVWSDVRERDEKFHNTLWDMVENHWDSAELPPE